MATPNLRARLNAMTENKKIEVDLAVVKEYLRLDYTDDDMLLQLMLDSAKGFVCSYTKQTEDELAELPEVKMAVLLLVSHFYDNGSIPTTSKNVDFVLNQTLGMHHMYTREVL